MREKVGLTRYSGDNTAENGGQGPLGGRKVEPGG